MSHDSVTMVQLGLMMVQHRLELLTPKRDCCMSFLGLFFLA
jgi:hypothetical protein